MCSLPSALIFFSKGDLYLTTGNSQNLLESVKVNLIGQANPLEETDTHPIGFISGWLADACWASKGDRNVPTQLSGSVVWYRDLNNQTKTDFFK